MRVKETERKNKRERDRDREAETREIRERNGKRQKPGET